MTKLYGLLLVLWLSSSVAVYASTPDSLRQRLSYVFQPLDKSQVPTGCLEEYATPLLPLALFNGTLVDSNRTNAPAWRMLYATYYSSRLYGSPTQPDLPTLNSQWDAAAAAYPGSIPVAVQRLDYAALRPDALTAGLLSVQNDQLYDVAGRLESPYLRRTLFAAAPRLSRSVSGTVSLVFPSAMHLRSGGGGTLALAVDFGDGRGYLTASWDQPITAAYSTAGTKRIKVRVTYGSPTPGTVRAAVVPRSEVLESHFDLEVLNPACTGCRYAVMGHVEFIAATSAHAGGEIHVRYGGDDQTLDKPLIVLEGFDISDVAYDVDDNYNINSFLRAITTFGGFNFYNALEDPVNSQYDIVFLDFNNGTDDITRNAELFKEVIHWVNTHKQPRNGRIEQNVVMGMSMGGLVARYGLADMVKNHDNPDTRLLICHDSPHRGANAPLGLQGLVRQAANTVLGGYLVSLFFPQIRQTVDALDSPAAEQMLIHRALNPVGWTVYNTFLDGAYRSKITFAPTDPQPQYRMIATSQGSQCGQENGLQPYGELVRSDGGLFVSPLPWLSQRKLRCEVIVNSLPNFGPAQRIASLKFYSKYRLLSLINMELSISQQRFMSPPNMRCWDGLPGGTINMQQDGSGPNNSWSFGYLVGYDIHTTLAEQFCFVPTASALDLADLTDASLHAVHSGSVSSVSHSAFERYIAQERFFGSGPAFNQTHIAFTARNGRWLFDEMQGNTSTANCADLCTPFVNLAISGPAQLCPNEAVTYQIPNLPSGATVSWNVSPSGAATWAPVGNQLQVTAPPDATVAGIQITASVNTGCGPAPAIDPLNVTMGPAYLIIRPDLLWPTCTHTRGHIEVEALNTTPGLGTWSSSNGQVQFYNITETGADVEVGGQAGTITITLTRPNRCGGVAVVGQNTIRVSATQPNGRICPPPTVEDGPRPALAVYPNPADDYIQVQAPAPATADGQRSALASSSAEAQLFDDRGKPVGRYAVPAAGLRLPTRQLPAGLYYLTLRQNGRTERYHFSIQH